MVAIGKLSSGTKHPVLDNYDDVKFFVKNDLVKSVQLFHRDIDIGLILSHMYYTQLQKL